MCSHTMFSHTQVPNKMHCNFIKHATRQESTATHLHLVHCARCIIRDLIAYQDCVPSLGYHLQHHARDWP